MKNKKAQKIAKKAAMDGFINAASGKWVTLKEFESLPGSAKAMAKDSFAGHKKMRDFARGIV